MRPAHTALLALSLPLLLVTSATAQKASSTLTNADCVKCHAGPPADIAAGGGKHKSEIGCQDCHTGHRPTSKANIPACSGCHDGKPHFKLAGCNGCHQNPHKPTNIILGGNITEPCLSCHAKAGDALRSQKSRHATRACTFCHKEHGKIPSCLGCHKPHATTMTQADCGKCHKAHTPKNVTYAESTPSAQCGSCHRAPFAQLDASKSKHHELSCATCHQEKHRAMPKCTDCHDAPHDEAILAKFGRCGECHKTAHDLNNWVGGGGGGRKKK